MGVSQSFYRNTILLSLLIIRLYSFYRLVLLLFFFFFLLITFIVGSMVSLSSRQITLMMRYQIKYTRKIFSTLALMYSYFLIKCCIHQLLITTVIIFSVESLKYVDSSALLHYFCYFSLSNILKTDFVLLLYVIYPVSKFCFCHSALQRWRMFPSKQRYFANLKSTT